MHLIIDSCTYAIAGEPTGGFTIKVDDIEGLPNVTLILPVYKETAEKMLKGARETMGLKTVEVADNAGMKQAVQDAGR